VEVRGEETKEKDDDDDERGKKKPLTRDIAVDEYRLSPIPH
jgi:hypothetical protein